LRQNSPSLAVHNPSRHSLSDASGRVARNARDALEQIRRHLEKGEEYRKLREEIDKLREEERRLSERIERLEKK